MSKLHYSIDRLMMINVVVDVIIKCKPRKSICEFPLLRINVIVNIIIRHLDMVRSWVLQNMSELQICFGNVMISAAFDGHLTLTNIFCTKKKLFKEFSRMR